MNKDEQKAIVLQFNEYINKQNIDGLATLMTDDHIFIDSDNHIIHGKGKSLEAWREFFKLFPDYRNALKLRASIWFYCDNRTFHCSE